MHQLIRKLPAITGALFAGLLMAACGTNQPAGDDTAGQQPSAQQENGNGMQPYDELITEDAETDEGLFDVHKVDDKYYYEIPDSLIDREMLLVSRISGTIQDLNFGGAGMKARSQQVIRWQKKDDRILMRHVSYENVADPEKPVYESVKNNNFEPVVYTFDIESIGEDSTTSVIEVTPLFTNDIKLISGLSKSQRQEFEVGALDTQRSFVEHINSYPENIEARHVLTYDAGNPPDNDETGTISLEMNQSMIVLPSEPMQPRLADQRVGYFSIEQYDYGLEEQKAAQREYITRWRLEPKDPEAYKRGELTEPKDPIVYYIDPATPERWRPYLKQGIEDWQKSFEEAGFKNAIIAKDPPSEEEDPEFSPEDVRYSVIRYITTDIQNAQGPHVHDPRTGEILESDILWYHNVMNLLRNWFFVQTAAANPDARDVKFEVEVMGELIRFVAAHEVGHTLGLPHNWGSSHAYPVDSLRSQSFTDEHGTAPSIMDYARFNYIAQPEDGVDNFYPKVGEYDDWSIKWGYTWLPEADTPEDEESELDEWVRERADDPRYFYGRQTGSKIDPRSQNEDLGDDAMKASEYGIANLKRITARLLEWTEQEGKNYEELNELHGQLVTQWNRYMGHVTKNVGGVYETFKTYEQDGPVYEFVPEDTQQKAVDFLNDYAFQTPTWLLDEEILGRINQSTAVDDMRGVQEAVLNDLLDPQRIARLIEFDTRYAGEDTYDPFEMMDDVRNAVWSELSNNSTIDVHRRNLQRAYLERMEYLMTEELTDVPDAFREYAGFTSVNVSQSDIRPIVREQLNLLREDIVQTSQYVGDRATRVHLVDLESRIDKILEGEE